MIAFACEGCGKDYQVSDDKAGKQGRCKGCGSVLSIPHPLTFEVESPSVAVPEPRPKIVPQSLPEDVISPQLVPVMSQNVQVRIGGEPKEANALGVAGVIVGVIAMAGAWIPFVGVFAIPLIFVGVLFSVVGFLVALTSKRTGKEWAIAGAAVNVVALVIVIAVSLLSFAAANRGISAVGDALDKARVQQKAVAKPSAVPFPASKKAVPKKATPALPANP